MPRVSVVIPAFNAERFLAETLASVLSGEFRDFEILVIDDGSKDRTAEVAEAADGPVRLLRQANAGMSASRNRGIQSSDSEFIALLDADDLWHPRKLALQVALMAQHPDVGLCYSEFLSWDGSAPPAWGPAPDGRLDERLSGWMYARMLLTNWVLPSSMLVRRSVFQAHGLFPATDQFTDDWEFTVQVSRHVRFAKLAARLVAYRETVGSLSKRPRTKNSTELMREALIGRYGLVSPQGERVDELELAARRYRGWLHFANMNVVRGDLKVGLQAYAGLLQRGPHRPRTALTLCKSVVRRAVPARRG
jgi:glycosyltransferase involved in cell wall biosynthesis